MGFNPYPRAVMLDNQPATDSDLNSLFEPAVTVPEPCRFERRRTSVAADVPVRHVGLRAPVHHGAFAMPGCEHLIPFLN